MSNTNTFSPSEYYDGINGISLDSFQTQIESKLRQPFTSLELPKSLSTTTATTSTGAGSGGGISSSSITLPNGHGSSNGMDNDDNTNNATETTLTPSQFILNLQKCFSRMTKPIQLRCLIGLLGFEPNIAKLYEGGSVSDSEDIFQTAIRDFLDNDHVRNAEGREDKWIQIMTGIIRGKLFRDGDLDQKDDGNDTMDIDVFTSGNTGRNKIADTIMKKSCDKIITSITDASIDAVSFRNEAEVALTQNETTSEQEEKRMEELLDSFQIGTDVKPNYVKWCFRLCHDQLVSDALPELEERCDVLFDESADVLNMDSRIDQKKADEERKELEQKERMRLLAEERKKKIAANGGSSNGVGRNSNAGTNGASMLGIKMRGVAGAASSSRNGRGNANGNTQSDTAALMMRSKKSKLSAAISGRMGAGGTAAKSAVSGKQRKAGFGRGAAAAMIGGKSLANPMARMRASAAAGGMSRGGGLSSASRRPGGAMSMKSGAKSSLSSSLANSSGASTSSRVAANRNKTKMKMIDVTEVEGLKKEEEVRKQKMSKEEARENRKRKIREQAAAKGLMSKKKWSRSNATANATEAGTETETNATTMNANGNDIENDTAASIGGDDTNNTNGLPGTNTTAIAGNNPSVINDTSQTVTAPDVAMMNDMHNTGYNNNSANGQLYNTTMQQSQVQTNPLSQSALLGMPSSLIDMNLQQSVLGTTSATNQNAYLMNNNSFGNTNLGMPSTAISQQHPAMMNNQQLLQQQQQQQQQQLLQQQQQQQPFHDNILMAAAAHQRQQVLQQQQQQIQQRSMNQRAATAAQFPPRLNASRPVQVQPSQLDHGHDQYGAQQQDYQSQQQQLQQMQQSIPQHNIPSSAQQQHQHPQITHHHQLLEKSNKLSADDRFRVEQFFTNRYNPTPEITIYKMKLNEEKTFDPSTNQTIKETLYIELDYTTGEFKKLKKIKKSQM